MGLRGLCMRTRCISFKLISLSFTPWKCLSVSSQQTSDDHLAASACESVDDKGKVLLGGGGGDSSSRRALGVLIRGMFIKREKSPERFNGKHVRDAKVKGVVDGLRAGEAEGSSTGKLADWRVKGMKNGNRFIRRSGRLKGGQDVDHGSKVKGGKTKKVSHFSVGVDANTCDASNMSSVESLPSSGLLAEKFFKYQPCCLFPATSVPLQYSAKASDVPFVPVTPSVPIELHSSKRLAAAPGQHSDVPTVSLPVSPPKTMMARSTTSAPPYSSPSASL